MLGGADPQDTGGLIVGELQADTIFSPDEIEKKTE